MKKISEITKEMDELIAAKSDVGFKPSQLAKMRKRVSFLRTCKRYLESEPKSEFVRKEAARLKKKLDLINDGFDAYRGKTMNGKDFRGMRLEYDKMMETKRFKEHLKSIKFILGDSD